MVVCRVWLSVPDVDWRAAGLPQLVPCGGYHARSGDPNSTGYSLRNPEPYRPRTWRCGQPLAGWGGNLQGLFFFFAEKFMELNTLVSKCIT